MIKVLLRQSKIPGEEDPGKVWENYKCGFPGLLDCYYTNTQAKLEEKGMALASEQNQETGTVANLCAADQANASVNRERGIRPLHDSATGCVTFTRLKMYMLDALMIT